MDDIIDEIIERTTKGEDWLDKGVTDLAYDQFIEIRKLAESLQDKLAS